MNGTLSSPLTRRCSHGAPAGVDGRDQRWVVALPNLGIAAPCGGVREFLREKPLGRRSREETEYKFDMALFMDVHTIGGGVSADDVAQAHRPTWRSRPGTACSTCATG